MTTASLAVPRTATRNHTMGRLAPLLIPLATLALLAIGQRACAEEALDEAAVAQRVAALGIAPDAGSLREVAPDVLQFTASGAVFHLVDGGRHLVGGTLIQLGSEIPRNLTFERMMEARADALGDLFEGDLLIYPAKGEKRQRLYVFTDPTCSYCQRFHAEVPALNAAGIEVAYVPFARGATAGPGFDALQAAWCSADARHAYSQVIRAPEQADELDPVARCSLTAAVDRANAVAALLGVQSTPTILTPKALPLGGYRTADELLQALAGAN